MIAAAAKGAARRHQSKVDLERRVDPLDVLELRAWARAYLWAIGELELHEAVDILQHDAQRDGLVARSGQDAVQKIIADAFAREGTATKKRKQRQQNGHVTVDVNGLAHEAVRP